MTTIFVGIGNFDYGGSRMVIAGPTSVKVHTYTGTSATADTSFPSWNLSGSAKVLGWEPTAPNFYSSADVTTLTKYSGFLATTAAESKFWTQYQWEDGGGLGTTPSPKSSITVSDRRFLNVTVPAPGSGTTVTRVFLGNGSTTPANSAMYSRATTSLAGTLQFSTAVYSGANPKTVSDLAAGQPGKFLAQSGSFIVDGDSRGTWHEKSHPPQFFGSVTTSTTAINSQSGTGTTVVYALDNTHSNASASYWSYNAGSGLLTLNKTGWWRVSATVNWDNVGANERYAYLEKNTTDRIVHSRLPGSTAYQTTNSIFTTQFFTASDTIRIRIRQNSGANGTTPVNVLGGTDYQTTFVATYEGPTP